MGNPLGRAHTAFKFIFLNCDGVNTNRKAMEILISELAVRREILALPNIRVSHGINRIVIFSIVTNKSNARMSG